MTTTIERAVPFDPRRQLALVRPAPSEPSHARRFLQRGLPDSWRFAHQMAVDLVRQLEYLAWAGRADAFDTYFLRQAEAMLRPKGLTELIGGQAGRRMANGSRPIWRSGWRAFAPGAARSSPRCCSTSTSGARSSTRTRR